MTSMRFYQFFEQIANIQTYSGSLAFTLAGDL